VRRSALRLPCLKGGKLNASLASEALFLTP
jgi:hypothetical protein